VRQANATFASVIPGMHSVNNPCQGLLLDRRPEFLCAVDRKIGVFDIYFGSIALSHFTSPVYLKSYVCTGDRIVVGVMQMIGVDKIKVRCINVIKVLFVPLFMAINEN
jgi:hypothetical protein